MTKPLPPNVVQAWQRGDKIEAIRLLRAATGLGLKESKEALEGFQAGVAVQPLASGAAPDFAALSTGMPAEVVTALQRGNKLEAIRLYRQLRGVGLKEAKEAVEAAFEGKMPSLTALAPGEVPRRGGVAMWIVLAVLLAALAVWVIGR